MPSLLRWSAVATLGLAVWAAPSVTTAADRRAIFTLVVDEVKKGEVLAVLRGDDVLLPVEALTDAGLKGFKGKRETIRKKLYVSLNSLQPDIKHEIDDTAVAIKLTANPSYLEATTVDLGKVTAPPGLIHGMNPSLIFNYGVSLANLNQVSVSGDFALSLFGNSLLETTATRDSTGMYHRGISSLTIDDSQDLRRLVVGDTFTPSALLGGGATVGGISLARNFALNPYFNVSPTGAFTGTLTSPSTVEVYVNGVLVRTESLPPGVFTLQNIPYAQYSGSAGTTQIVVRDAYGREQSYNSNYYLGLTPLAKGTSDYAFAVGAVRQLGSQDWSYSGLAYGANLRYGLTSWLTPALHVEGNTRLVSSSLQTGFLTPIGSLLMAGAFSMAGASAVASTNATVVPVSGRPNPLNSGTTSGAAASGYTLVLNFARTQGRVGVAGSVQYESNHYSNLSTSPDSDRDTIAAVLDITLPVSELFSLTPEISYMKDRDNGTRKTYEVIGQVRASRLASIFFSAGLTQEPHTPDTFDVAAGISFLLDSVHAASFNYGLQEGGDPGVRGSSYGAQFVKSPPVGPGFGYLLEADTGPGSENETVQLQDHGSHGWYTFNFARSNQQNSYAFTFSGSLAALGMRVFAGPPVYDSFALIRTGVPDVEGYSFNQPIGHTDSRGDLLVPNLMSDFGNLISINDRDIPVSYRIDATKEYVAPPYRGGTVVNFPVYPVRSVIGKLLVKLQGKSVIPSFGTLTMTAGGKSFESPIGRDGTFFLDSPPDGTHPAEILFDQGTCRFAIEIKDGKNQFVKLGTLTCAM